MADPTLRPATPGEILLALKARLAEAVPIDPAAVLITAAEPDDIPHMLADRDLLLRKGEDRPGGVDFHPFPGGGRFDDLRTLDVECWCRSRAYLDAADDAVKLTDLALGLCAFEDKVCDACQEEILFDEDGNGITLGVIVGPVGKPTRDKGDAGWVKSKVELRVQYLRQYTLPELVV